MYIYDYTHIHTYMFLHTKCSIVHAHSSLDVSRYILWYYVALDCESGVGLDLRYPCPPCSDAIEDSSQSSALHCREGVAIAGPDFVRGEASERWGELLGPGGGGSSEWQHHLCPYIYI